jgi:hypothetical protein
MENVEYNLALLITGGICWAGVRAHQWWRAKNATAAAALPAAPDSVKNQVSGVLTHPAGTQVAVAAPAPGRPKAASGQLEEWAAGQPVTARPATLVARAATRFGVSASTAWRAVRRARGTVGKDSR